MRAPVALSAYFTNKPTLAVAVKPNIQHQSNGLLKPRDAKIIVSTNSAISTSAVWRPTGSHGDVCTVHP